MGGELGEPDGAVGAMSFRRAGGLQGMSEVRVHISVSADGYVAGPNQSLENPLGGGGRISTAGWSR